MAAFASNPNPYYALGHALWGAGWWFVVLAIINSAIGVGLACTNAASRVMYTMGQAGTLPPGSARFTPCTRPRRSRSRSIQLSGIVAILLVGLLLQPEDIFGFLGTIATLAVIVLYCMANLALTSYIRREHPDDFNVWRHGVMPWIGTLALLPVLFVTVYPVPPWPYNITPYLFIVALIVGFGYMQWRESRHPGALAAGRRCWSATASTPQGDVDWDAPSPPVSPPSGASGRCRPGRDGVELAEIGMPDFGLPSVEPSCPPRPTRRAWPRRRRRRPTPGWTRCWSTPTGSTSRTCPT